MDLRAFHQLQARLERIAQRLRARKDRRRSPYGHEPRHLPATRRPGHFMKIKAGIFWIGSLALCAALLGQVTSRRDVVNPETSVSLDPAGRGSSFQIAVVMKIRPGFHVNAREKSEDYLIATDLKAALPAGFNRGEVSYPKGKLEKFAFSKIPLNVYQDTVILRVPVTARSEERL